MHIYQRHVGSQFPYRLSFVYSLENRNICIAVRSQKCVTPDEWRPAERRSSGGRLASPDSAHFSLWRFLLL